jgi:hypothetical protein
MCHRRASEFLIGYLASDCYCGGDTDRKQRQRVALEKEILK